MSDYLLSVQQVCDAYSELRTRVSDLMRSITSEQAQTIVPHCPQWTVKDCLAHMIGVPEDVINGQMDGVATDAWTDRQVQRHARDSVEDLLTIWDANAPMFGKILPNIPQPIISQFMFDQTTHEHDIRHALSTPGARDSLAIAVAEGFLRNFVSRNADTEVSEIANTSITGFEFVRSLSGRRTFDQISEIGLPANTVAKFIADTPFSVPTTTVVE
ncbi:MAG: maleylpyruvate isomerase N-terminal domain-containing protein [Ilumatobacteraceae bacterium]